MGLGSIKYIKFKWANRRFINKLTMKILETYLGSICKCFVEFRKRCDRARISLAIITLLNGIYMRVCIDRSMYIYIYIYGLIPPFTQCAADKRFSIRINLVASSGSVKDHGQVGAQFTTFASVLARDFHTHTHTYIHTDQSRHICINLKQRATGGQ